MEHSFKIKFHGEPVNTLYVKRDLNKTVSLEHSTSFKSWVECIEELSKEYTCVFEDNIDDSDIDLRDLI